MALNLGRLDRANALREIGGGAEIEVTVGSDGFVRDVLVTKSQGGARVEALAERAAFSSRYQPATLNGKPVAVRLSLTLRMQ